MGIKRHKPEEIVTKLRQVEVLCGQGMERVDAIRQTQITALPPIPDPGMRWLCLCRMAASGEFSRPTACAGI